MENINSFNENYNRLYARKKEYIDTYYNYKKNINVNNTNNYNLYNKLNNVNANFNNLCNIIKKTTDEKDNHIWNNYNTYSSDTSKLICDNIFKQNEKKEFIVDIKKVAKQQINISNKLESNKFSLKDFKISIKYEDIETTFDIKTLNKTNFEVLDELDAKINKSNLNVYSELTTKENMISISIISNKTGKDEKFNVNGSKNFIDITGLNKVYQKPENSLFTVIDKIKMSTITEESTTNNINIDNYNIIATIKNEGKVTIENKINKKSIIGNVKQFVESYNIHLMHCKENIDYSETFINSKQPKTSNASINCLSTIGIYKDSYGFLHIDEVELSNKIDNNSDYVKNIICGKSSFISTLSTQFSSKTHNNNLVNNISKNNSYNNDFSTSDRYYSFYKSKLIGIYNQFGQYGMMNSSIIGILIDVVA